MYANPRKEIPRQNSGHTSKTWRAWRRIWAPGFVWEWGKVLIQGVPFRSRCECYEVISM
jgi:hypothetical protein